MIIYNVLNTYTRYFIKIFNFNNNTSNLGKRIKLLNYISFNKMRNIHILKYKWMVVSGLDVGRTWVHLLCSSLCLASSVIVDT